MLYDQAGDYRLVSIPQVDVGLLPLRLPIPDNFNSGGYAYGYSPIDLLVAGLEAHNRGIIVSDLVVFFDGYRDCLPVSCHMVSLLVQRPDDSISAWTLGEIATRCNQGDDRLLTVMQKNAPLTFKWVKHGR